MRHARSTLLLLAAAAVVLLPSAASAQPGPAHPLYACATRVANALRNFTQDAARALAKCEKDRITTGSPADCATDQNLAKKLDNLVDDLRKEVNHKDCDTEGNPEDQSLTRFRALCPVESRWTDKLLENVGNPDEGTRRSALASIVADVFLTEYAGCPRPATVIPSSSNEGKCIEKVAEVIERQSNELAKCHNNCERHHLNSDDFCTDADDGEPVFDEVQTCVAEAAEEILDVVTSRCTDQHVQTLGCPLGASDSETFGQLLADRLLAYARETNRAIFHSSCRTVLPGPPPVVEPAQVTLEPSGRKAEVSCGQVLDGEFFGRDKILRFDTNLDCTGVTEAANGIVIDKNGVTIDGRGGPNLNTLHEIIGPGSRSLRKGAGILIKEKRKKVRITNFRRISNWGVGILAEGKNQKLRVDHVTLFRNIQAGLRTDSPKSRIKQVIADRNGIGFDIAGNNTVLQRAESRRSEPQTTSAQDPPSPGFGFYLHGEDVDGNGSAVRCAKCKATGDVVAGIVLDGYGQVVVDAVIRDGRGNGVVVGGTGNRLVNSSVKFSAGDGVVVTGDANTVNKNQSDENQGAGYRIEGTGNVLKGNGAGSLTDKGNAGPGFLVIGAGNLLDTNEAEANAGSGFVLQAPQALFKSNSAESNGQVGFEIVADRTTFEDNTAEKNVGFEWVVAPNNFDDDGNRANGKKIVIPSEGGSFEQ